MARWSRFDTSIEIVRRWVVSVASLAAVASFVAEYGFYLSSGQRDTLHRLDLFIVGLFLLNTLLAVVPATKFKKALMRALPLFVIASVFLLQVLVVRFVFAGHPGKAKALLEFLKVPSLAKLYFIILQLYVVTSLLFYTQQAGRTIIRARFRPARLLVASFVLIILAGTLLLKLPRATPREDPITSVDALFTATSAVCVTGLVVVDTASDFTRMGQWIILFLMQIGGLGIMTFAAFFALLAGRGLSIKERLVFGEVMQVELVRDVSRLVVAILVLTFSMELLGTLLFYGFIPPESLEAGGKWFVCIFHAVSGFCNAGFSVFSDGFMRFKHLVGMNLVMTGLIVLGGLGFTVHRDLLGYLASRFSRKRRPFKLRLQTRVVLVTTFALLVGGTLLFVALERGKLSTMDGFFQSATSRTAGFSTTSQGELRDSSLLLTMFLMFIGAAPGSTGGGIKVTTLVVFLATVAAMFRGRSSTEIRRKTIPDETVREAVVVFGLSLFAVVLSFMLLLIIEDAPFKALMFETVSAFGTVGLSLGVTPSLSGAGKLVVTCTMLFGRIGPMTLALAVAGRLKERGHAYPHERIMVG